MCHWVFYREQEVTIKNRTKRTWLRRVVECAWVGGCALAGVGVAVALGAIDTTVLDFYTPGTQPNKLTQRVANAAGCAACHGYYDRETEPFEQWAGSLMAQASRDPIFHACLAIANQDASYAGDLCLRCHTPGGWLMGRVVDAPDGSGLQDQDRQGVSCNVCHRMVDPVYRPGESPEVDESILANILIPVITPHNASMVMDPMDRRRGPFDISSTNPHPWLQSPYHRSSSLCASCHDVSNPVYMKQPDGSYLPTPHDEPHPTHNKYDMYPIERTFSEWANSLFAAGPVEMGGRFGGNRSAVSSCQDCHMPSTTGTGCEPSIGSPVRHDLPRHFFNGANTWVLKAIRSLYNDAETFLDESIVNESIARAQAMMRAASDLELTQAGRFINARIINYSGHKLPTGYAEGRVMWINVKYFDAQGTLVDERGHYDNATAELDSSNTKTYEAVQGLDAVGAAAVNRPQGPGFHFAVNNTYFKDNRIPPMGFTNAAFAAVQASPLGADYADGQYWDDTLFDIPDGATRAEVRVFHQVTTKEYIEFLRDQNTTNTAGQIAYDQWVLHGKSPPTEMDFVTIDLSTCFADTNGDGGVDGSDVEAFFLAWEAAAPLGDFNLDGGVDGADVEAFFLAWESGC